MATRIPVWPALPEQGLLQWLPMHLLVVHVGVVQHVCAACCCFLELSRLSTWSGAVFAEAGLGVLSVAARRNHRQGQRVAMFACRGGGMGRLVSVSDDKLLILSSSRLYNSGMHTVVVVTVGLDVRGGIDGTIQGASC